MWVFDGQAYGEARPRPVLGLLSLSCMLWNQELVPDDKASQGPAVLDTDAIGLREFQHTTFSVVDVETTGLIPGADRIVEIAIVRIEPQSGPRMVLETLVNPVRPMAATEIHGITADDVAKAPTFAAIAHQVVEALSDSCVVGYNASFDIRMLERELQAGGLDIKLPYLCLLGVRADLGIAPPCSLEDACRECGVDYSAAHSAAYDALCEADLLLKLLARLEEQGITRLGHLLECSKRKYCESLVLPAVTRDGYVSPTPPPTLLPRQREQTVPDTRQGLRGYQEALTAAVADGVVTEAEMAGMSDLRDKFSFRPEEIRSIHARVFGMFINLFADDEWLSDAEVESLRKLRKCLTELGWSPGD